MVLSYGQVQCSNTSIPRSSTRLNEFIISRYIIFSTCFCFNDIFVVFRVLCRKSINVTALHLHSKAELSMNINLKGFQPGSEVCLKTSKLPKGTHVQVRSSSSLLWPLRGHRFTLCEVFHRYILWYTVPPQNHSSP